MSGFINGGFGLAVTVHARQDYSACDQQYFGNRYPPVALTPWRSEVRSADNAKDVFVYSNKWWPRGSAVIIGGGMVGEDGNMFLNKPPRWIAPRTERGANGRLAFVGYTRDEYGSALGDCTVRCYRVSTEEQVSKVLSDANGLYFATSPYNDEHFLVIHNPAGDQAGATKNTITPA